MHNYWICPQDINNLLIPSKRCLKNLKSSIPGYKNFFAEEVITVYSTGIRPVLICYLGVHYYKCYLYNE